MRRVVITGIGVVSPLGSDSRSFIANLLEGRSGVRRVCFPGAAPSAIPVAAPVDFDPSPHFPPTQGAQLDRATQFAVVAARQAVAQSALEPDDPDRIGVYWGTGMGGAGTLEQSYRQFFSGPSPRLRPLTVVMAMSNAAAAQLSIQFGFCGPLMNYSTACASSACAIGEAYRAIRFGIVDAALAGGSEALLTPGTLCAWGALRVAAREDAEDPSRSCKPFARDRTGLVLGEGAAALVLESADQACARGAPILAEVLGYSTAADASHLSRPDAAGESRAMRLALQDAKLDATQIDYVNAHGTATLVGDTTETVALKSVFGAHAPKVPVSSTKSMHGHLMGAAGAIELAASVLAMAERALPPTANLRQPDPACDLDYVPNTARHDNRVRALLSNSFAFGGTNACLVAGEYRHAR